MPPRALVLATGEEVPRGRSIRARLLIIELGAGDVKRTILSECQRAAQAGRFVEAMGGFVAWMGGCYEEMQCQLRRRVLEIRNHAEVSGSHARLAPALAELQAAWEIFLQFAAAASAIGMTEKQELERRGGRALGELAGLQAKYQVSSDPALQFLELLRAALRCGRAHLVDRQGGRPADAAVWGWQRRQNRRSWVPQGIRIGWVRGRDLFLEPVLSYQVAQELGGSERLTISAQTLRRRLGQRGLLVSTDAGRQMVLVRRTLEGRPRQVLHLAASALVAP
jgi:hypothetical protein